MDTAVVLILLSASLGLCQGAAEAPIDNSWELFAEMFAKRADNSCPFGLCHQGEGVSANQTRAHFEEVGLVAAPAAFLPVIIEYDWTNASRYAIRELKSLSISSRQVLRYDNRTRTQIVELDLCSTGVKSTISAIDDLIEWASPPKQRKERGAFQILADILGFGMVLGNSNKLSSMTRREDTLYHNQRITSDTINELRQATYGVSKAIGDKQDAMRMHQRLAQSCHNLSRHLNDILRGLYQAIQGEISPALIGVKELHQVSKRVDKQLKIGGYKPVFDGPTMLLSTKNAAQIVGGQLKQIFLVPFVDQKVSKMNLWAHLPVALQRQRERYIVDQHHQYVAHSKALKAYMPLSNTQLASCVIVADTHVCHGERLLEKKASSCIVALFTEDGPAAEKYCHYKRQQQSWVQQGVYQQQADTFGTTTTVSINQTCYDNQLLTADLQLNTAGKQQTTTNEWPMGRSQQVDSDCLVVSQDFVIMPTPKQLKSVRVTTDTEVDVLKLTQEVYNHDELSQELSALRKKSEALEVPEPVASSTWIWVTVGVSIFVVVAIIAIGAAYAIYRRLQSKATGLEDLNTDHPSPKDIEKEVVNVIEHFVTGPTEEGLMKKLIVNELKDASVNSDTKKNRKDIRSVAPGNLEGEYVPARLYAGNPKLPSSRKRNDSD